MDDELESTPTTTPSDSLAAEILDAIEAIAGRIPRLEMPHPMTAGSVRGGRTVPDEAILSMIAAVEDAPQLQTLGTFNVDNAREMLQFNHAFRPVIDRLNLLTASISFTMEARKAQIVFELLRTYEIMKGLARHPSAGMIHHVETLRRDIGRKNPGRKVETT
jgi:hypothetical protein